MNLVVGVFQGRNAVRTMWRMQQDAALSNFRTLKTHMTHGLRGREGARYPLRIFTDVQIASHYLFECLVNARDVLSFTMEGRGTCISLSCGRPSPRPHPQNCACTEQD